MLDLDNLAEVRARMVNEKVEIWRAAVWSAEFQKLSASMSDGEVEILVGSSPSVSRLRTIIEFLNQRVQETSESPYAVLMKEAGKAGMELSEWIKRGAQ